jgi:hypothetical protein
LSQYGLEYRYKLPHDIDNMSNSVLYYSQLRYIEKTDRRLSFTFHPTVGNEERVKYTNIRDDIGEQQSFVSLVSNTVKPSESPRALKPRGQ